MAFPNTTDIVATTIQSRSRAIADNVTKNNALLAKLNMRGNIKPFSGGNVILQELSYAQNGNGAFYSGYDLLPVAAADVISAAEYNIKQLACPVVISGLEMLQNSGKEAFIDLLEGRINVAESTMSNLLAQSIYSDGTGSGGKEITGLNAQVPSDPTTGTVGGINRATWTFWRSQLYDFSTQSVTPSATTIQAAMNSMWASQVRGSDRPDLIVSDSIYWTYFMTSLQAIQRFTSPTTGSLGFPTIQFMDADVVLDGGIGGYIGSSLMFSLNTKYIFMRPHKDRNMVALAPEKRYAVNQDAQTQILAFAGNLTSNGLQFQGRIQA